MSHIVSSERTSRLPACLQGWRIRIQEHIGWKCWKLMARTISPTPFALRSPKANKRRLKIMDKTERGRIQGLPKFMRCLQLSQERLKLWTSNLTGYSQAQSEQKAIKIWRQGGVGVSRNCPIFWIPPINPGTGKAKSFKFCTHIHRIARIARDRSPLKCREK